MSFCVFCRPSLPPAGPSRFLSGALWPEVAACLFCVCDLLTFTLDPTEMEPRCTPLLTKLLFLKSGAPFLGARPMGLPLGSLAERECHTDSPWLSGCGHLLAPRRPGTPCGRPRARHVMPMFTAPSVLSLLCAPAGPAYCWPLSASEVLPGRSQQPPSGSGIL